MAKPKVEKKREQDGEKSDGLEIISIGSLYSGPWDKKYWSSSRGKDRYPYPVGYVARRAHNGSTYKMEIHEGPKGPVFLITSGDGHSSSGQTPDISWGNFQKTSSRNVKILHGKRFSCKIDGMEFFGFKNQFVQRLLRELVSNVNGIAEKNLISSSFCNGASGTNHNNRCLGACALPDLQQHLERAQITTNRNKRCKITNPNLLNTDGFKSSQPGDSTHIAEASNPTSLTHDVQRFPWELPAKVYLQSEAGERNNYLTAKDSLPLKSIHSDCPMGKNFAASEESKLAGSENCKSTKGVSNLSVEVKPLCKSEDIETERMKSPMPVEEQSEDAFASKESQDACDLCAPDSVDFMQGTLNKTPRSLKEDIMMTDVNLSGRLMGESNLEEEIGTSNSNENSEKSGFDSVGQEIAKTMMTVFLPQAIPLLKRTSSEKKNTVSCSQNLSCLPKPHETYAEADYSLKDQFSDASHLLHGSVHIESIVPDSFDDDNNIEHEKKMVILPFSNVESEQPSLDRDPYPCCSSDVKESLLCHVEISESKNILCHHEPQLALSGSTQYIPDLSEPVLPCMTSTKKIISEEDQGACKISDEKLLAAKIQHEEEEFKPAPNSSEAVTKSIVGPGGMKSSIQPSKDSISRAAATETEIVPITHATTRVYTRKKLQNEASSVLHSAPLSESIICRSSKDFPETMGNLLNSDMWQIQSSVEKPYQCCSSGAKSKIEGQIHAIENHQPHVDGRLLGQKNVLDSSVLRSSLNPDISSGNEGQGNTCLKLERNLKFKDDLGGIVELVGCYFHLMPLSSLMLTTKGNEIYIAALCDMQLQREKTLFLYNLEFDEPRRGWPCFVGHFSVSLPSLTDMFGRDIAVERSGLQFTPDGKCLILLGSIKTPYCREGRVDCLCSTCTSDSFEHCSVKIVQVKAGYVSVVVKVRTADSLQCVLASEPNHLIAAGDSGRLHLWTMNSTWSAPTEEVVVQANDCISPCIVELKGIPKSAFLVIGHNGFGEFTLWDISRRIFVSRFSAASTSVYQFLPICLFSWQRGTHGAAYSSAEKNINRIMNATKFWSSEHYEDHSFHLVEAADIAIWLLVSTATDSNAQHDNRSCDSVGQWGLALLAKKMFIVGNALDPRAVAVGASAGYGIVGTLDGLVYIWELTTGINLGTLYHFEGGSVSCIAADHSSSGIFAIASDRGELLVYRQSRTAS